jgi:hypothetical protein
MTRWFGAALAAGAITGLLLLPTVANADVTGGCTGVVFIDGVEYGPQNDTPDNPIVVPDRAGVTAEWAGEVPFANTNFAGEAGIVVGPTTIRFASWSGANTEDIRKAAGTYSLDELKAELPVDVGVAGIYQVKGFHDADGGSCTGMVFVKFEGNPLSTPLGVVAVVGIIISALGLFTALWKHPVVGAIFGLLFGLFLALVLQQWSVYPLTTLSVIGLPLIFLGVGILLGVWGPMASAPAATAAAAPAAAATTPPPPPPAESSGTTSSSGGEPPPPPPPPPPPTSS